MCLAQGPQHSEASEAHDIAEFMVRLIHRKQVPLLHNTVLILCNEEAEMMAMIMV